MMYVMTKNKIILKFDYINDKIKLEVLYNLHPII